ncbi:MAG: tyrosine--tRNA ligase [Holosporales bacterium]|jgi:tyrosyl-tRNA synthetase|nr:tyrosine--tRNA ligase [Holosporales bacterium]
MSFCFSNSILSDLFKRGFIYQATNHKGIDDLFNLGQPVIFYIGFDPTADSLHVGHLLWIKLVGKLKDAGHNPIVLCGGATAKIGDPTWKDESRSMLDYSVITDNINSIMKNLQKLVGNVKFVDNNEWISKLNYLEFLRDYGRFFSVNKMLTMDSVSERLKRQQHLSFLEFNYALLQAYDFLCLFENENCVMQIGGADQWSNIISGVDLVRRIKDKEVYGMTIPLLTNAEGKKMGKTAGGSIWLNPEKTSPFDFWQYWRNVDDKDVCKLMKIFTDIDLSEIEKYQSMVGTEQINDAKIKLADSITSFVHSKDEVNSIKQTVDSLFGFASGIFEDLKTFKFKRGTQIDKIVFETGLAQSMTQARKLIEGGAIKISGETVTSIKYEIKESCTICSGKKHFVKAIVK